MVDDVCRPSRLGRYTMIKLLGEIFRQTNTQIVIVSLGISFKGPEHETIQRITKDVELDNGYSAHTGGGDFRAQCILECVAEKKLMPYR